MYNTAPKYKKIEIILNKQSDDKPYDWYNSVVKKMSNSTNEEKEELKIKKVSDPLFSSKEKYVFEDAALVVTGGYILITQEYGNDDIGSERSTSGRIFDLKDVYSYKAYFEQR
jgi:hypothetical protein